MSNYVYINTGVVPGEGEGSSLIPDKTGLSGRLSLAWCVVVKGPSPVSRSQESLGTGEVLDLKSIRHFCRGLVLRESLDLEGVDVPIESRGRSSCVLTEDGSCP